MLHNVILIHNNSIVNHYETDGYQLQFIWNGQLTFRAHEVNTCFPHDPQLRNPLITGDIKEYKAIYLDGVQLVKRGRLITTPFWKFWKNF